MYNVLETVWLLSDQKEHNTYYQILKSPKNILESNNISRKDVLDLSRD